MLIELQKFNSDFDIRHFRRYLAENYHEPSPSEVSGKTKAERDLYNPVLPILSIYLLGFPLTELKGRILTFGSIAFEAWEKLLFFSVREHETGLVNPFLWVILGVKLEMAQSGGSKMGFVNQIDKLCKMNMDIYRCRMVLRE